MEDFRLSRRQSFPFPSASPDQGRPTPPPSSNLGNLAGFRTIATDAKALLDKGDVAAAKTRLKDLEMSWDEAEAGLKPRAAAAWHEVDKAIDRTLAAVRSNSPDLAACKAAITNLIAVMDRAGGPT